MKLSKLLLISAIFATQNAFAGIERTAHFNELKSYKIDQEGFYADNISLENLQDTANLSLVNIVATPVQMAFPSQYSIAEGKPSLDIHYGIQRKKLIAGFKIPTFYKENGVIFQIKSFDVLINENPASKIVQRTYVNNSVLSSGNWYKIAVNKRGVFKIDYNLLQSMGLNPSAINPNNIRIYGNGGTVIPEKVLDGTPDDLVENAIFVSSTGSTFGQNDYILFYANGPLLWNKNLSNTGFDRVQNIYEDKSYYFINVDLGPGKRIQNQANISTTSLVNIDKFDEYQIIEKDTINLGQIGKEWFGHKVNRNSSINLSFDLKGYSGQVRANLKMAGIVEAGGIPFSLKLGNQVLGTNTINNISLSNNQYYFYDDESIITTFTPTSNNLNFTVSNSASSINSQLHMDYLMLNYLRPLSFINGQQINFRSFEQLNASSGSAVTYTISNSNGNLIVWDVSNNLEPKKINSQLVGSATNFLDSAGILKEYIAFDGSQFNAPTFVATVENQNLHALPQAEYLIITHSDLKDQANRLADIHRNKFGTTVNVVTIDKIYNEFSSGSQDIGGIRNFIKMFYDRTNGTNDLKNVLLLGTASYDYKNRITNNTNIVPTYETQKSSNAYEAYATDEYFTLLDEGESILSTNPGNYIDIGIGRIPAKNAAEAANYIEKVEKYVSPESFGEWKNNISFVSDDYESGFKFLQSIEQMSDVVKNVDPVLTHSKLYADIAPRIATPSGTKFPTVTRDINNQIYNGTFLLNYIGHGSPTRWATEEILYKGDINQWNNINKLPLVITATCDFGRFDNPFMDAAGVYMVMKNDGGAIASLTTTQVVFESQNNVVNEAYLDQQFKKQSNGKYLSFGEAFMAAKNNSQSVQDNSRKFVVLGDPALKPSLPENIVITDSIFEDQGNNVLVATDSLKALGRYIFKGHIADAFGNEKPNFNGNVSITIYDKLKVAIASNPLLLADTTTKRDYWLQNNILFKGNTEVVNGAFSINVILPKDINYDYGKGKIVYYAYDNNEDATSLDTTINVGGFSPYAGIDNDAPIVKPYIDNNLFRSGDIVSENPLLYVELSDNNGINVSGATVGHDLIAILDGDYANPYVLNSFYRTNSGDYTKGSLHYQLAKLAPGKHTLTVRAWDVYNNSGEGSIDFVVKDDATVDFNLYNYPNPFKNVTNIVFQHNQTNVEMDVSLKIFATNGQMVYNKSKHIKPSNSFTTWQWDGSAVNGATVEDGVYMCQLSIKTLEGKSKTLYHKIVFVR